MSHKKRSMILGSAPHSMKRRNVKSTGLAGLIPGVPNIVLWGAAALAIIYLLNANKDAIEEGADEVIQSVSDSAFKLALPSAGQQYGDVILQVAKEQGVSPLLVAAIMWQESNFGAALSPPGPAGTGDAGHGRGLVQVDDRSFGPDANGAGKGNGWLAANDWTDPYTNITKGVQIFKQALAYFANQPDDGATVTVKPGTYAAKFLTPGTYPDPRPLTGADLLAAAIAAYNSGPGNVLKAVASGAAADATTSKTGTGASAVGYATSVLNRIGKLTSAAA